jgi:hypothetical protein
MNRKRERWEGPLLSPDLDESGSPERIRLRNGALPGWTCTVRFGPLGEVDGLAFDTSDWREAERAPMTAALVHGARIGDAINTARRIAAAHARMRVRQERVQGRTGSERFGPAQGTGEAADLEQWGALVRERTGTRGKDDEVFARVAAAYVELVEQGERAPLRHLAEMFHMSESRARNVVHEARARGLLTATKQGRPGGRLTAKAQRIIEGIDDGAR